MRNKLIELVAGFKILPITGDANIFARKYLDAGVVVENFYGDALHLAVASVHRMDYLVSWNFRHMVNVRTRNLVSAININNGLRPLEIIAPPELR